MASLRDRLLGKSTTSAPPEGGNGAAPNRPTPPGGSSNGTAAPPAASSAVLDTRPVAPPVPPAPTPATPQVPSRIASMYASKRSAAPVVSPVEQLKVDLHRRLIERLDLEAL